MFVKEVTFLALDYFTLDMDNLGRNHGGWLSGNNHAESMLGALGEELKIKAVSRGPLDLRAEGDAYKL